MPAAELLDSIGQVVLDRTQGRPFAFVLMMMELVQKGRQTNWYLGPSPPEKEADDYVVCLFRYRNGQRELIDGKTEEVLIDGGLRGIIHKEDHGIVVRAPHPDYPGRMVLILAGAHSLGTAAACLAATRSPLIREIKAKGIDLADKKQAFWVLVRGTANPKDYLLDEEGVTVVEAGVYD
jgi:hypothetical protein